MSNEIKQGPVDNQPAKELSTDELGKVTGGCFGSLVISAILKPQGEEPPQSGQSGQSGQKDPLAQVFQQLMQGPR
jgi:hypothetical protein